MGVKVAKEKKKRNHHMKNIEKDMMNTRKSTELKIKRESEKNIGRREVKKKKSTLNIKNIKVSIVMTNIKSTTIQTKTETTKKNDEIGISMVINMIEISIGKEEKQKKN